MLWWIVQNAVVSGLLAAAVAVACRVGRPSPALKHALWLLVLIKLVTPPVGSYRVPAVWEARLRMIIGQHAPPTAGFVDMVEVSPDVTQYTIGTSLTDEMEGEGLPPNTDVHRAVPKPWRVDWLVFAAWLAGAVPLAAIQATRLLRLMLFLRCSTAPPAWLDRLIAETSERLRVRPPQVAVVPVMCSPMIVSFGRPRLLWPVKLADRLSRDALQAVVLHELAHLRRRDHWVAWLELVAGVIWWFDPVYWYVRWQLRENAEWACDAWVIALLPSGRRAYAQALIGVTEFVSCAPAALPAVAMGNIARTSLERRLTMILRETFSHRVPLIGSGMIGLALLAVLPGWSRGQQAEPVSDRPGVKPDLPKPEDAVKLPDLPKRESNQPGAAGTNLEHPMHPIPAMNPVAQDNAPTPSYGTPAPTPGVGPLAPLGGQSGVDQRIRHLEAKLAQLLAEVQQLRGGGAAEAGRNGSASLRRGPEGEKIVEMGQPDGPTPKRSMPVNPFGAKLQAYRAYKENVFDARRGQMAGPAVQATDDVETLTRARYKLPQPVAEAAVAFIGKYFKPDIGATVEGDVLTIIASPEDQQRISVFVELLRDSGRDGINLSLSTR